MINLLGTCHNKNLGKMRFKESELVQLWNQNKVELSLYMYRPLIDMTLEDAIQPTDIKPMSF